MPEKLARGAIDMEIARLANAPLTVAAIVRTVPLIADRMQRPMMRPLPKAPHRSGRVTASNGHVRIVRNAIIPIAASAAHPTSGPRRNAPMAIVPANLAQVSLAPANVGQANTATVNIVPVNIGVSVAVIIAQPAKLTDSIRLAAMRRPDVIVTKPASKPNMRRRRRLTVAAAKAVRRGAAPMRRSS
jgi:hypothetical protein